MWGAHGVFWEAQGLRVAGTCNSRDKRCSWEENGGQIFKDLAFCFKSVDLIPKFTENCLRNNMCVTWPDSVFESSGAFMPRRALRLLAWKRIKAKTEWGQWTYWRNVKEIETMGLGNHVTDGGVERGVRDGPKVLVCSNGEMMLVTERGTWNSLFIFWQAWRWVTTDTKQDCQPWEWEHECTTAPAWGVNDFFCRIQSHR